MHRNVPRRATNLFLTGVAAYLAMALQSSASQAEMSEDVRRMHERLVATAAGRSSLSGLRIEFLRGGMAAHQSFTIESGKLVTQEWDAPGSRMIRREGSATDARVTELLQRLITAEYWKFQGTRFVPDAPTFVFRFHAGDGEYVDFRCDEEEIRLSPERRAIRELFLDFVADTELRTVSR